VETGGFVSGLIVAALTVDGEKGALACSNERCKCVVVFGERCRGGCHECRDRKIVRGTLDLTMVVSFTRALTQGCDTFVFLDDS
jgi:hypothetical protein